MLKQTLQHPEIARALAAAGHGSQILITDSNYPVATEHGPNASVVYLNLAPDLVKVTDVLKAINDAVPVESAVGMTLPDGTLPPIFDDYKSILDCEIKGMKHTDFKKSGMEPTVCLHVATGDTRIYSCILLTMGYIAP
ncbi:MAG TPA: RbsD/FucU domain-containing protein [Fimbriimonadaceae bacterium]|nr:RbsD/FucU domain-containing protein [Fimbriimonadaceae bacterium]